MLTEDFVGMGVFDTNLRKVGKLKDLDIDKDTLQVNSIIVESEDDAADEVFGRKSLFKKSIARIPKSFIEKIGDVVILNSKIGELKAKIERFEE
ncbi:MAG: PRC-barrel domain-containing protein [Candidatus Bathyarchaeia archaeon]